MRLPPISQQQPASSNPPAAASQPSQPAKPASQASQPARPANVASGHPSLRPSGIDGSKLLYRGIQSVSTGGHRRAQAATARQTFWHPQHQGDSQTFHKPIKYRRYSQLPSKSCGGGHGTNLGRPFQGFRVPTKVL